MQFDALRAFPYPVLRPNVDDYIDGDIQVTVDVTQSDDLQEVIAEIQFAVSVPELLALVSEGRAQFAVVFACRDTYFRKSAVSKVGTFTHKFIPGQLRGEVLIYPYLVATADIKDFMCKWINSEFGDGPFAFEKGAALAVDAPQSIYVDRDSFKPISSAFDLVKDDNLPYGEWRVKAEQDRVHIAVHPDLKARIDLARNGNPNKALLLNSIYMGAVMQCLSYLKQGDSYDDFRWASIFKARCAELSIEVEKHPESWVAQQLMKVPFKAVDGYFFGERGHEG
jgi:hypothetical protein